MTRKEFVTKATESLAEQYSPGEAKAISVRILSHFLGLSEYEYSVEPNVVIPKPYLVKIQSALEELAAGRPVQYVIGEETFAGRIFHVSEAVLIPRPETEQMCRLIIDEWRKSGYQELRILDACTGSGCIAWTLAAAFPKAQVLAFDVDEEALEVAKGQRIYLDEAGRQPLQTPPVFFKADILEGPPEEIDDIDILVSNPPYVCESEKAFMAPNVLDYEPEKALFVPDSDPLRFYKAEAYGEQSRELFESRGFSDVEVLEDFRGKPRFVTFTKWF